jgi:hypothetical protein
VWFAAAGFRAGLRVAATLDGTNRGARRSCRDGISRPEPTMPYTRPISRFYLTPPSVPVFLISVVLALLAVFAVYGHLSLFKASSAFLVLLIAYIVLAAGVLIRGV